MVKGAGWHRMIDDLIAKIESASVIIPPYIMAEGTGSGIPYAYVKGVVAGIEQVIEIIRDNQA
jgi:hypothetical protein